MDENKPTDGAAVPSTSDSATPTPEPALPPEQKPTEPVAAVTPTEETAAASTATPTTPAATPVTETPPPTPVNTEPATPSGPTAPAKPATMPSVHHGMSKWLHAAIFAVLLVIIGVAVWFVLGSDDEADAPSQDEVATRPIDQLNVGLGAGVNIALYPENSASTVEYSINSQIFEGLVRYEDRRTIQPLLATGWVNPDENTWEFDLKPDVQFHNGSTLTADDVVFSINEFAKNEDVGETFTATIASAEAVSDSIVRITTDGPDPLLLNRLTNVFIIDDAAATLPHPDSGTGPYTLMPDATFSETKIELTAFNNYHGGSIEGVQNLTFEAFTDDEALTSALQAGEIDVLDAWKAEDGSNASQFGYDEVDLTTPKVTYLGVNHELEGSPTLDPKFREAVYRAIDVDELLEAYDIEEGRATSQYVTRDIPGYNPDVMRLDFDQDASRTLLEEIAWSSETDTVELTYFVAAKAAADNIAKQLAEVGITVTLDEHTEGATIGGKVFGTGTAQMWFAGFSSDLNDAIDVFSALFDESPFFNDADISSAIDSAATVSDAAQRLDTLESISADLAAQIGWVPLYESVTNWYIRSGLDLVYELDQVGEFGVYYSEVTQR